MIEFANLQVHEHLERILGSSAFAKADRLRRLLRFVVEKTLAGEQHAIKEYSIALEVCGRPPTFDGKIDPIVRVDATRLRARLEAYYSGEGRTEPIRIQLPKGSYVPTITAVATASSTRPRPSLAVLPFVNLNPPPTDDAFAEGLTDELIHQLSRIPELRVIARTSAFQYRGKGADLRQIASELGVAFIVEGSVRGTRDQIRVTAQLTHVNDLSVCWSDRYERALSDVLTVQDDICRNIARALRLRLVTTTSMEPARPPAAAHVEYLKGRHFWNRRTASSLAQSLHHYGRAIAIAPHYAAAHCGIADTVLVQAINEQIDGRYALSEARMHADRALQIAPDDAEALTSAAAVASILEWDWIKGEELFRRAIAHNPSLALAHYLYAIVNLAPRARWDEALIGMDRALELDPVSPVLHRDLGIVHYLRGDNTDAEAALRSACALDAAFHGSLFWLARTFAEQRRFDLALEMLHARLSDGDANTRVTATLVHTLGMMGRLEEAHLHFARLKSEADSGRVPALNLAIAYLGLAQHDAALDCLERACGDRAVPLYQIAVDPIYRPLRQQARFQAILREMRLDNALALHS